VALPSRPLCRRSRRCQRSHEGTAETIDPIYVVAYDKLIGFVPLRDLILDPTVARRPDERERCGAAHRHQEEVAVQRGATRAIPVRRQGRDVGWSPSTTPTW
jgi:Mg/Co/Ni transporter MgtE